MVADTTFLLTRSDLPLSSGNKGMADLSQRRRQARGNSRRRADRLLGGATLSPIAALSFASNLLCDGARTAAQLDWVRRFQQRRVPPARAAASLGEAAATVRPQGDGDASLRGSSLSITSLFNWRR
ncbi:uncharacterized protein DS421_15g500510 [Arachis hypogaea]|nr:uncharacterized protein DS421_15g500510 [Arachis hypogaea]